MKNKILSMVKKLFFEEKREKHFIMPFPEFFNYCAFAFADAAALP